MVTLAFLAILALVFGAILAWEGDGESTVGIRRPTGLLTWLTSGNWPAKVGGGLLIVGIGALLRYGLLHVDVAPPVKLAAGILLAGLSGLASVYTGQGPGRRAVSLALGGTAFGVAYLTAYSAFGLFGYLPTLQGVALLALTSIAAGVYAVTQSALSLACLAMLGAYVAPAFGIEDPGPAVVYGYYCLLGLLTLGMVALRGWRPLIHLSLLFTVAGGAFFAWTSQYYRPEHADVMLPMLVALAAIHVALPIVERGRDQGDFLARLDVVYLLAVPGLTALATVMIAPGRTELASTLAGLSAVWLAAALFLRIAARDGVAVHGVIGFVLLGFAAAAHLRDLPWELIVLAFVVGTQAYALYRDTTRTVHSVLAGLALMLGALHVIGSLDDPPGGTLFMNGVFIERILGAGLLILSGRIAHRAGQSLEGALLWVGIGWALVAIGGELLRWDLLSFVLVMHGLLVVAGLAMFFLGSRLQLPAAGVVTVVVGVLVTAAWAAATATPTVAAVMLVAAPLSLVAVALRSIDADPESRTGRLAAATLAPLVAGLWAMTARREWGISADQFPLVAGALVALVTQAGSRRSDLRDLPWVSSTSDLFGLAFGLLLLSATVFRILPNGWAVLLELLCVAGLTLVAFRPRQTVASDRAVPIMTFAAALVLQANLLRALGPPGELSIIDLPHMQWPTLISLLWAMLGGALTIWGRRRALRSAWVAGATLLVAAVVKLVLFDFGSLGQLANILAVIAAGVVFLLVGWLAPMPPASTPLPKPRVAPHPAVTPAPATPTAAPPPRAESAAPAASAQAAPATAPQAASAATATAPPPRPIPTEKSRRATQVDRADAEPERRRGWMLPLIALGFIVYSRCSHDVRELLGHPPASIVQRDSTTAAAPPSPPAGEREVALDPADEVVLDHSRAGDGATSTTPAQVPVPQRLCDEWRSRLPPQFEVIAIGAYAGRDLGRRHYGNAPAMTGYDVVVNRPGRSVVLMLGSHEPGVWNIRRDPGTNIVGVWASGYHPQEVTGLWRSVPVLRTHPLDASGCPYFYFTQTSRESLANAIVTLMRQTPAMVVIAEEGRAHIGDLAHESRSRTSRTDSSDLDLPSPGMQGIRELVDHGKLRRATVADVEEWQAAYRRRTGREPPETVTVEPGYRGELQRTYVVLAPIRFPPRLAGTEAAAFIVPYGVERPRGRTPSLLVMDMNR